MKKFSKFKKNNKPVDSITSTKYKQKKHKPQKENTRYIIIEVLQNSDKENILKADGVGIGEMTQYI